MSTVSFSGLLIVSLIAVAAPILVASVKCVKREAAKRRRGDRRRDYRRAVCSCLGEDRSAGQCGGPAWPLTPAPDWYRSAPPLLPSPRLVSSTTVPPPPTGGGPLSSNTATPRSTCFPT